MCLEHKQYWQCCLKIDSTYIDSCPLAVAGQRCHTEERVHPIGGYCVSCRRAYNKLEDDVCTSPKYSRNDGYTRPWESQRSKSKFEPNPRHRSPSRRRSYSLPKEILKRQSTPYAINYNKDPEPPNQDPGNTISSNHHQSKEPSLPSKSGTKSSYNRTSNTKYRPVKSEPLTFPTNYYSYPPPSSSSSPRSRGGKNKKKHHQHPPPSAKDHDTPPTSYPRSKFKPKDKDYDNPFRRRSSQRYRSESEPEFGSEPESRRDRHAAPPQMQTGVIGGFRVASPETVSRLVRKGVLPGWVGGAGG